jgi:hypothetical protein
MRRGKVLLGSTDTDLHTFASSETGVSHASHGHVYSFIQHPVECADGRDKEVNGKHSQAAAPINGEIRRILDGTR